MLGEIERKIQANFHFNEKDSKQMLRVLQDVEQETGMSVQEILDFIVHGGAEELSLLHENYDWRAFKRSIQRRLRPNA
ncbi:MAG: hypothetical protein AAF518_00525 [Spirochaetota bacterium]